MSPDVPGVPLEILPFLKQRPELSIFGTKTPKPPTSSQLVHYRCDVCSFETSNLHHYKNHMMEHNSQRDYPCPVCGKNYKSESRLQVHMQTCRHPEPVYPHVCIYCEKRFKNQNTLNNHMKSHFPEEVTCSACNKQFSSKSALKRHIVSIHSNDNYPK